LNKVKLKGVVYLDSEVKENLVKKTCKELGITQKELAKKIGITERTISRYATGETIPKNINNHLLLLIDNKTKTNIIDTLKVSIDDIQKIVN
jgi:transcriptional regulator with XRE-family HTH domain